MKKWTLLTGATDGIGLETAKRLVSGGQHVLLHGRNASKMNKLESILADLSGSGSFQSYLADLSILKEVDTFAQTIVSNHDRLDVLINNAGVLKTRHPVSPEGLDVRFAVNTIAPYLLTKRLLPLLANTGRVINLSSAAQATVNLEALSGGVTLSAMEAYSQSKLAITMWSRVMAQSCHTAGPVIVAVNPGSLLASKMVTEGFGVSGKDIGIGADILIRAAISDEFADASGLYFDNDAGRFATPHRDALDQNKSEEVVKCIESVLSILIQVRW